MITNFLAHIKALPPRRLSLTILSFFSVLVIILLIWKVPEWQARGIKDAKDRATIENAARATFVQALGGLFLFITAYFTSQNLKVAQANLDAAREKQIKDAEVAQANLEATQEKQVTERFAKAIEQLGSESIHVRLGAIYALERISKDSDKDYWQVMEVLTAYVRETSPYPPRDKAKNKPLLESILSSQPNTISEQKDILPIATDIQAVLTIIARRKKSYEAGEENYLDLNKTDLSRAKLSGAILILANLRGANLRGANLRGANLRGAILIGAILSGAILSGANLSVAILIGADLRGADLSGAILIRANLIRANLRGADLSSADLRGADLSSANLSSADLSSANLSSADLSSANLSGANLSDANLSDAYLSDANLSGANLSDAYLSSAYLSGADLSDAYLSSANLSGAYLSSANLSGAYLSDANLSDANLRGANLRGADLSSANLIYTEYLTLEQVKAAKSWEEAKYDEEFRVQLGLPPETAENQEQ